MQRLRLGLKPDAVDIRGQSINAASIAGFRPRKSTLDTKKVILGHAHKARKMVLAFGQVDLELGYYFRKVIKEENITPTVYVDWLIDIYAAFIADLKFPTEHLAVKGVNLTVLGEPTFTHHYVKRIITERQGDHAFQNAALSRVMLSENQQNSMHLDFNRKLKLLTATIGVKYFDLVEETSKLNKDGNPDPTCGLDILWAPSKPDHHLVDSLATRKLHFQKLFDTFGFQVPFDH